MLQENHISANEIGGVQGILSVYRGGSGGPYWGSGILSCQHFLSFAREARTQIYGG